MSLTAAYIRPLTISPVRLALALFIMVLALAGAEFMKPSKFWSDEIGSPKYEHILPKAFGPWVVLAGGGAAVVDPIQSEMLDKIYSETVSRTYLNQQTGRAIMLSIAYGRDQSTDTQLHTPDMCYASQGFRVDERKPFQLSTPWGAIPAVHMKTAMGQRNEPLTYFVRTGDHVTDGSLQRNLARLGLALRGYKIDGLLVRVSEVTRRDDAFAVQEQFLVDLMKALGQSDRPKLIGKMPDQPT
jgi:EpsI family protein